MTPQMDWINVIGLQKFTEMRTTQNVFQVSNQVFEIKLSKYINTAGMIADIQNILGLPTMDYLNSFLGWNFHFKLIF